MTRSAGYQEENTKYHLLLEENWSGWSRVNLKSLKSKSVLNESWWKTAVSVHSQVWFASTLTERLLCKKEAITPDAAPSTEVCYLIHGQTSGGKLWSGETKTELSGHNEHQCLEERRRDL